MKNLTRRQAVKTGAAAVAVGATATLGLSSVAEAESYARPTGGVARELWDNWQDAVIVAGNMGFKHGAEKRFIDNPPESVLRAEYARREQEFAALSDELSGAVKCENELRERILGHPDASPAMRWVKDAVGRVLAHAQRTSRIHRARYDTSGDASDYLYSSLIVQHMEGALLGGAS